MDNMATVMLDSTIKFCVSCMFDLVLFCIIAFLFFKVYKTKNTTTLNTNKIHNLDEVVYELEQTINQKG
jgi:hypothetical protein